MSVWLVTAGEGVDGDEWRVLGVFSTLDRAREWVRAHNAHAGPGDEIIEGGYRTDIEEWPLNPEFTPQ